MSKRWAGLLLGVAGLLSLTACGPKANPYFALVMADGKPTVLIAECARDGIDYVTLWESGTSTAPPATRVEWSVEAPTSPLPSSTIRVSTVEAPARITLLETPPEWLNQRDTLPELRDGVEYYLSGGLSNPGSLTFTLAQLRAMAPGEVLTVTGYTEQHVVPEKDWRSAADQACDR
ncbi:hypothetical protein [Actinoplanes sp. L3-i22]|uniref:hypothetical protein n=1 Tax=Actinoplanes sp. L3-i22 TaxID=2836373 RepID=UPI001C74A513|nr:hypothetical protein [Actinoplanes sp. L3-i22]BCY08153.1 hypothetical protein L3i22_032410 [Actinoplanes sp. L3-i22]